MAAETAARVAKAKHPGALLASLSGRAVEARPLKQAAEEGMAMAARLSACVANATAAGEFGRGNEVFVRVAYTDLFIRRTVCSRRSCRFISRQNKAPRQPSPTKIVATTPGFM